jgi:hypothetical protein
MLRVVVWAGCSAAAVLVSELVVNALWTVLWGVREVSVEAVPLWPEPEWWAAALVYGGLLVALAATRRPTVRRLLLASVAAAVVYVAVGSVLSVLDDVGFDLAGWGEAVMWGFVVKAFLLGTFWIALLAPVLLGVLPMFRRSLVGRPVMWTNPRYTAADDDAAAEDFGIY